MQDNIDKKTENLTTPEKIDQEETEFKLKKKTRS